MVGSAFWGVFANDGIGDGSGVTPFLFVLC